MKHAAWLVVVVVIAVLCPAFAGGLYATAAGPGSGTPDGPYLITSCVELQAMNRNLARSYALANDIDCSDTVNWNGGAGFVPVGTYLVSEFTGDFDGQNHVITNLFINRPGDSKHFESSRSVILRTRSLYNSYPVLRRGWRSQWPAAARFSRSNRPRTH